jgi:hypothetical protein
MHTDSSASVQDPFERDVDNALSRVVAFLSVDVREDVEVVGVLDDVVVLEVRAPAGELEQETRRDFDLDEQGS